MSGFEKAVVFGKFWPLHLGHLELIDEAVSQANRVLVVVDDGDEDVPTSVRMGWIKQEFSTVEVVSAPDLCGHDSVDCTLPCSERYANWLSAHHGYADVVVSGESYGALLASCLGADSVRVDRNDCEMAGRSIRSDLTGHWNLLSGSARAWYCRRVVIVGAESTGTTTLTADIAERLGTVWVPEYGRRFTEECGIDHSWQTSDFEEIARHQAADEDEAARLSGPILVCDTDVLATAVWHERYMGSRSEFVEGLAAARRPDLYVITADDIPFVQDGMRDGEHVRSWMTERFREVVGDSGVSWLEVRGTRQQRVEVVLAAVASKLHWIPNVNGTP
jgi:HTH-type transcriptional regulator, transcriptional repressor of NAD biosynthesis genes